MSLTIICNSCGVEFGSSKELRYEGGTYTCPKCESSEDFSVITQHNPRWDDDSIQFPRLLAEIAAIELTEDQIGEIAASMDVEFNDIAEIFDRAQAKWEEIKTEYC